MNEFIKMDIFFFIASVSAILLTVLLIIVLVYLVKILRDLKYISTKARIETEKITEDIESFRQSVKQEGFKIKSIVNFASSIFKKKGK